MLEIQTFGSPGLRSRDRDRSVAVIVQQKRLVLLAFLAMAPKRRCRRRDQLVGLFWPELDEVHARSALSQALSHCRRALPTDAIITQGEEEVGLDRDLVGCDALVFNGHCEADQLEEALQVYQGPFLDAVHLPEVGSAFEQWLSTERRVFQERASQAASVLAERTEAGGDLTGALGWARRAASIAPGDEVPMARVVRLLDRTGDRASALRYYDDFRQRLKDEFQIAPSRETQALIAQILAR